MGTLYFVRHGQTEYNLQHRVCGSTDINLTKLGIEQARQLGEKIAKDNIHIDHIIASPLKRAADTAKMIGQMIGKEVEIDERITEQNFGKYEGLDRDCKEFYEARAQFLNRFSDGESFIQVAARVYNLLDELKENLADQTVLIVAHNGIARILHSYFVEMSNEEISSYGIDNCQLVKYTL